MDTLALSGGQTFYRGLLIIKGGVQLQFPVHIIDFLCCKTECHIWHISPYFFRLTVETLMGEWGGAGDTLSGGPEFIATPCEERRGVDVPLDSGKWETEKERTEEQLLRQMEQCEGRDCDPQRNHALH